MALYQVVRGRVGYAFRGALPRVLTYYPELAGQRTRMFHLWIPFSIFHRTLPRLMLPSPISAARHHSQPISNSVNFSCIHQGCIPTDRSTELNQRQPPCKVVKGSPPKVGVILQEVSKQERGVFLTMVAKGGNSSPRLRTGFRVWRGVSLTSSDKSFV